MAYRYADIEGDRTIRVFEVQSATEEEISGNLICVSLNDHPAYEALSYAWGNPTPTRKITCGGRELEISVNCYGALLGVYGHFKTRSLWIDAICINQSNGREKATQVTLMRDIYSKAKRVFIWLGVGNDLSNHAFDWIAAATDGKPSPLSLMDDRYKIFPENMEPREILKILRSLARTVRKKLSVTVKMKQVDYRSNAMRDLFGREWFKRMWTLQELVMASDPILVCGSKFMPWNNFFHAIKMASEYEDRNDGPFGDASNSVITASALWFHIYARESFALTPEQDPGRSLLNWFIYSTEGFPASFVRKYRETLVKTHAAVFAITASARLYRGKRPFNSWLLVGIIASCAATMLYGSTQRRKNWKAETRVILGTLHRMRARQASESKDMVFALYGVFQQLGFQLPKPDYSKSIVEVYTEFTCAIMFEYQTLDILAAVIDQKLPGASSWVPDWSKKPLRGYQRLGSASRKSTPIIKLDKAENTLRCTGRIVDSVNSCTPLLREGYDDLYSSSSLHNISVLRQWISTSFQHSSAPLSHPAYRAIFETLNFDNEFSFEEQARPVQLFKDWISILIADHSRIISHDAAEHRCAQLLAQEDALKEYHIRRCKFIASNRALLTTENGYVGLGLFSAVIGDKVALLAGCSLPVIIKPAGLQKSGFSVVGVAWISGLMNGEKWFDDPDILEDLILY